MIDIEKIKRAALAATQGEWISQHWSKDASDVQLKSENTYTTLAINCSMDDATHISAANPSAVLELITRLEAAEASSKFWEGHANDLATQDNKLIAEMAQQAIEAENAITDLLRKLEAAKKEQERERMRLIACGIAALGYFEGCHDDYKSASLDYVLRLRDRLEATEKDAARYRWLLE